MREPYYYLCVVWIVVVIGFYSITKSGLDWYIYSAYIPIILLGADALGYIVRRVLEKDAFLAGILTTVAVMLCFLSAGNIMSGYPWNDFSGGHAGRHDVQCATNGPRR